MKESYISGGKKVAVNTFIIYAQKFSSAALSLITTPLLLRFLGIDDFGLLSLCLGFVSTLGFLSWSLSSSTQRSIGVAIGGKNFKELPQIFSTAFFLHIVFAFLVFLLIAILVLTVGGENLLNVKEEQNDFVAPVLMLVGIISFCSIISIPFTGLLRANENFKVIAIMGVSESLLKLTATACLYFFEHHKIYLYSSFLATIALVMIFVNFIISQKLYVYAKIKPQYFRYSIVKEMLVFISWSFLGALAVMSRNQGVSVIINLFFGVVKNAAYGVSLQINAAIAILSQGVQGAISPKIIKSAGAGNQSNMIYLMRSMSKLSIFSVAMICMPLFFNLETVLYFWLGSVPEDTVLFVKFTIISSLVMLFSTGIQTVFDALGKVKLYNLWVSVILLFNLPVSYLLFKFGDFPAYTILLVSIFLEIICLFVRVFLLKRYINFSMLSFFSESLFQVIAPIVFVGFLIYLLNFILPDKVFFLISSCLISLFIYPLIVYKFSLDQLQKELFNNILLKKLYKFSKSSS